MNRKKELSEQMEPVTEAVGKAAAAVTETAKDAAKAAEPTVKAAQKKLGDAARAAEPTVKAAQKKLEDAARAAEPTIKAAQKKLEDAAKAAEPTIKATQKKLRDTGKRAASALIPEVYVQWGGGREALCAEVVERAKQDYRATHKGAVRSCRIYLKPEDGCAYYVINDTEGKVEL